MNMASKKEYLTAMRVRYQHAHKQEKTVLISEVMVMLKIVRKSVIRTLNRNPHTRTVKRTPRYLYDLNLQKPLKLLWEAMGKPCAKRLQPQIPTLITQLEKFGEIHFFGNQREQLCKMSNWTINQLLVEEREKLREHGLSGTRRSPLLKTLIPISTHHGKVNEPGHMEIDCVLHCGDSLSGIYAETINSLDIYTHWNEKRMVLKKTKIKVIGVVHNLRDNYPFPIQSVDFDNGFEFVNWSMYGYCKREQIAFTRSRSYHKNDQAHIEGKNYESVRRVVGYGRIEDQTLVDMWNDIYEYEHRLLTNYFYATMKLEEKKRVGGKIIKRHGKAKTPYQRVLEAEMIPKEVKARLQKEYETLNPLALQRSMKKKMQRIQTYMSSKKMVTVFNLATYQT
jgi:hypothetical protein